MKDKMWNKDKLQERGTSEMEQDAKIEKEQQDIADRTFERLAKHAVSPLPALAGPIENFFYKWSNELGLALRARGVNGIPEPSLPAELHGQEDREDFVEATWLDGTTQKIAGVTHGFLVDKMEEQRQTKAAPVKYWQGNTVESNHDVWLVPSVGPGQKVASSSSSPLRTSTVEGLFQ